MDKSEFDKFALEYEAILANSIGVSGEEPEFFAEYKIRDTALAVGQAGVGGKAEILDFGSGVGSSIPFFGKYFPGSRLTCVDVSSRSLEFAERRFPGQADFCVFDGTTIPFPDNRFDVAFSACVFHHIPHEEHVGLLRELFRVLRPGGRLVIFEHNPFNPLTRRVVNACPFDENAVLVKASTLMQRLRSANFPSVSCKYRIFFPRRLEFLRGLESLLGWVPLGAQYYVAAEKPGAAGIAGNGMAAAPADR